MNSDQNNFVSLIKAYLEVDAESKWYRETWGFIKEANQVKKCFEEKELKDLFNDLAAKQKKINDKEKGQEGHPEEYIKGRFVKDKVVGTYELATYLTKKYELITVGSRVRDTYVYKDGMYSLAENLIIYPEIQRILQHNTTKTAKNETIHKIQDMTSKPDNIFEQAPITHIPLKNGVYNISTKELLPHSPEYKFKYQFPIIYNKEATCPKTESFLDQVLTPEQRDTVEEWIGYYFYRNYMFKKAIIFVGEGDTGKTTLLEVITHLLGTDNISSIGLHKMTSDRFAGSQLYEKHGNIVDELSAKDITDTGNFKIATGGGNIVGEYKFGNQFSFINYAKFTFACNRIPDVQDMDDDAYFNRWMVINFGKTIENKIPNFIETLKTEEERSGLFNLAMKGLERLLKNQHFTYMKTGIDTKLEMMKNGSSIAKFVKERLQESHRGEITNEDMYKEYTNFCEDNELRLETQSALGSKLEGYAPYIKKAQVYGLRNGNTVQVRGWRNVGLIPTEKELEERESVDTWIEETAKTVDIHSKKIIEGDSINTTI